MISLFPISDLFTRSAQGWIHGWSLYGSFSDNFNFSMKKASRANNFCFISKRHVVFMWQSVGQIKTRFNAQKYKKD